MHVIFPFLSLLTLRCSLVFMTEALGCGSSALVSSGVSEQKVTGGLCLGAWQGPICFKVRGQLVSCLLCDTYTEMLPFPNCSLPFVR